MYWQIGVCVLFSLGGFAKCCKGQSESQEYSGLRDVAISNAESWLSYDVLIRRDLFYPNFPEKGSMKRYTRLFLDLKTDKCFGVDLLEAKRPDEEGGNQTVLVGFTCSDDGAMEYLYPGGQRSSRQGAFSMLDSWEIPDLRCIGLYSFPTKHGGPIDGENWANRSKHRNRFDVPIISTATKLVGRVMTNKDFIQVSFPGKKVNSSYHFDTKTVMPERSMASVIRDGKTVPSFEEDYVWKQIESIYVPTSIIRESYFGIKDAKGDAKPIRSVCVEMATIHWFSLNEPFDKSRFDSSQLKDVTKLRKLVNPKETGATEIE